VQKPWLLLVGHTCLRHPNCEGHDVPTLARIRFVLREGLASKAADHAKLILNSPIGIWKTRLELECVQVTNEDKLNLCRIIAQNARNLLSAAARLSSPVRNRQTEQATVT